jgi:hypothetical protein
VGRYLEARRWVGRYRQTPTYPLSARERAAAEARRVARERLAAESRRRARAGEAGPGRAAKRARCDDPPTADAADGVAHGV